jgi:hypothetical protein
MKVAGEVFLNAEEQPPPGLRTPRTLSGELDVACGFRSGVEVSFLLVFLEHDWEFQLTLPINRLIGGVRANMTSPAAIPNTVTAMKSDGNGNDS